MKRIHYFGIRHHGVGSSKRLVSALDRLQPKKVLIEGASDCTELLPLLAHAQMKPPVALLAYASDVPECHVYYPFASFSPEYQAVRWAVAQGADVALIDLPMAVVLAQEVDKLASLSDKGDASDEVATTDNLENADDTDNLDNSDKDNLDALPNADNISDDTANLRFDPIGVLGKLAGYADGEGFWDDVIEQTTGDELAVFESIHQMMRELRQKVQDELGKDERDEQREAFMRQEIRRHTKELDDDECMAVVCGAWHVPALDENFALMDKGKPISHSVKSDTALLKSLPKKLPTSKIKTTWIPYTSPRLSRMGQGVGYGAGVDAPMWYEHLWQTGQNVCESWLAKVACVLRERGQVVSTASVIEAVRLAQSLSVIKGKRAVGFEELTEAVVACLCFGEKVVWEQIAEEMLLGGAVGTVPDDLPLAPLLEDLERLKKQTKLKAEAIPKELDVDLRSEIGLKKSHLLHRLNILGVNWGELGRVGRTRGTFRERWELCWQAEFAVALVENLVYGNTIFEASSNRLSELMAKTTSLSTLAEQIQQALEAGLDKSAMTGIARLSEQATHTDNVLILLKSLSPLISLQRYGTARKVSLDKVGELIYELTVKASVGLPLAIKNISDEEAGEYHEYMTEVHSALKLSQDEALSELWWQAIGEIVKEIGGNVATSGHLAVVGLSTRLLYQAHKLTADELSLILQKTLSPVIGASQSARFFEGFFKGAIDQLLYDKPLLTTLEAWLLSLDEGEFTEYLPLFRRVFSELDSHETKRLMEMIFGGGAVDEKVVYHETLAEVWQTHLDGLLKLMENKA